MGERRARSGGMGKRTLFPIAHGVARTTSNHGQTAKSVRLAHATPRFGRSAGFSMVEVVVAIVIVGLMYVAAINTLGATRVGHYKIARQQRALLLAHGLMAEITQHPYWDRVNKAGLGPAADETVPGDRSLYDDVDDYNGWSMSPPEAKDGTPLVGYDDWRREVDIVWVDPSSLSEVGSESGVKRITVTVQERGVFVTELVAYRTLAWDESLVE